MAIKKKTDAEQYQYVCMFEEPKQARLFKNFLASSKAEFTHLEDAGHTICFVGSTDMLAIVETYKIPDGITLQLERRPVGSDPDDAEADGTVECFAYYGTD